MSPALPQVSGRQIVRALERAGFNHTSTQGSHAKLRHGVVIVGTAYLPLSAANDHDRSGSTTIAVIRSAQVIAPDVHAMFRALVSASRPPGGQQNLVRRAKPGSAPPSRPV